MVTERQNEILNLVVDIFTKTHEPVGSKALQDVIQSSSATIRNDMAALEKQGLLFTVSFLTIPGWPNQKSLSVFT